MLKNTEPLDYMFIHTFGEDFINTTGDFPLIALDFLRHAYPDIQNYTKVEYAEDSMEKWAPDEGLRYKILNAILSGARHGDSFSVEMLCRLYKVYYKREYNQLKRFRSISYDELCAFENEEELFETTAARILTICPLMGIEVDRDCETVLSDVQRIIDDETFEFKLEPRDFSFDPELFREAGEEARQLMERRKEREKKRHFWKNDIYKFKEQVFRYLSLREDFDLICNRDFENYERSYTVTIALLKQRFRGRSFTDDEINLFHEIYQLINAFTSQIGYFDEMVDMMLGRTDKFSFEIENCRYQPAKQPIATTQLSGNNKAGAPGKSVSTKTENPDRSSTEAELIRELSDLRASLKQSQRELEGVKRQYLEAREESRRNRIDEERWEADRQELYRLREYVYSLTQEDILPTTVDLEEMKKCIRDKKIIIVGGHENWVGYLKEIFPSWTYIKPSISNTLPESHALNADYLFFFTDTISHGSFGKYMNVVRKHELPYSYLHGTNIDRTISSIYKCVKGQRDGSSV